jgi:tetratricopeptide (TPR) repeat protein
MKEYDKAVIDFSKAIVISPKYGKAYINRGNAYYNLKDTVNACADWNKALELGVTDVQGAIDAYCK